MPMPLHPSPFAANAALPLFNVSLDNCWVDRLEIADATLSEFRQLSVRQIHIATDFSPDTFSCRNSECIDVMSDIKCLPYANT